MIFMASIAIWVTVNSTFALLERGTSWLHHRAGIGGFEFDASSLNRINDQEQLAIPCDTEDI